MTAPERHCKLIRIYYIVMGVNSASITTDMRRDNSSYLPLAYAYFAFKPSAVEKRVVVASLRVPASPLFFYCLA